MAKNPNFKEVFSTEINAKIGKNRLQIIKFILICFVPFLYGFICCWAFWNPLENARNIPMAVLNHDDDACVAYAINKNGTTENNLLTSEYVEYFEASDQITCKNYGEDWFANNTNIDKNIYNFEYRFNSMVDLTITTNKFYNSKSESLDIVQDGISINLKYLKGQDSNITPSDKYWAQLQIQNDFTKNIFKMLRLLEHKGSTTEIITELKYFLNNMPLFWSTYKQNFLAGQVMYTFTQIKTALVHTTLPEILGSSLFWIFAKQDLSSGEYYVTGQDFVDYFKNLATLIGPNTVIGQAILSYVQANYPSQYEVAKLILELISANGGQNVEDIVKQIFPDLTTHVSWEEYSKKAQEVFGDLAVLNSSVFNIPVNIQGYQYGEYGIGLGEFFIAIGMWVGVLMQTFIFDRNCRTKQARSYQHYFSKLFLMIMTTIIQITILTVSLAALGFSKLGPPFGLLYLWLLFGGIIFTIIEHAIWFAPNDGDVGKYLIVIYMILNLTAGWGTFPSFMQANFFNVISVITPFKYLIHGMGDIIYGISSGQGSLGQYQTEIFQNLGILLIWIPILMIISMGLTYLWRRKDKYGTINLKVLKTVLVTNDININKNIFNTLEILNEEEINLVNKQILIYEEDKFYTKKNNKIYALEEKMKLKNNPKYQHKINRLKAQKYIFEFEDDDRDTIL